MKIKPLKNTPETITGLSTMLVEVVANGGSVGFMHPLTLAEANSFWTGSLAATGRWERIILGAFDSDLILVPKILNPTTHAKKA